MKHKSSAEKCTGYKSLAEGHARSMSLQNEEHTGAKGDLRAARDKGTYHVGNTDHRIKTGREVMFRDERVNGGHRVC